MGMRQGPRSEPTPLTRAVVAILNHTRDEQGVSVHALAKAVAGRVSRSQLYDLLDGRRMIDLAELFAICDALGISATDVLDEAQGGPSSTPETDTA